MVAVDYPIIHCYSGIRWLVTDYVDFCQLNLLKNSEIHWFQFIMNSSSHHTAMDYGSRSALWCKNHFCSFKTEEVTNIFVLLTKNIWWHQASLWWWEKQWLWVLLIEAYYTFSYIAALHSGRVFWLNKYTQYTHQTKKPDFAHCAMWRPLPAGATLKSA